LINKKLRSWRSSEVGSKLVEVQLQVFWSDSSNKTSFFSPFSLPPFCRKDERGETENERDDFSNACLCNDFTMFSVMSESGGRE
jgi:hypothetical protein